MRKEKKLVALRRALGFETFQKGDEVIFFCKNPNGCNGKHHNAKLSVNIKTDAFHCWVCDWKAQNLKPILRLGDRNIYEEYVSQTSKKITKITETSVKRFEIPVLPKEFRSLSRSNEGFYSSVAKRYLESRGIDSRDILRYKLGYCEDGEYRYRIIIPSFDEEGNLNFFVGRSFNNDWLSYKHDELSKDIVFNEYMIDWEEPIILVEGPFDAIIAGDNAIPLQGSNLNEESLLFNKIIASGSPVYLALDADAYCKQVKLMNRFMRYGVSVGMIDVSKYGGDVAEIGKEAFIAAKNEAVIVDSEIAALRFKVRA